MHRAVAAVAKPRTARRRLAPLFDRLEGRELMAVSAGQSLKDAVPVVAPPLQLRSVDNNFGAGTDQHTWKVRMAKGDFVNLALDTPDGQASQITVLDESGAVVAKSPRSADPSMLVGATKTGVYYVKVTDVTPQAGAEVNTLNVRKFAIDKGLKATADPSDTDERWAWASGKTLYIAESNGTGYGITADWKKEVTVDPATNMKQSVYVTQGKMTVDVKVPVTTKGSVVTSTASQKYKTIQVEMTGSMKVATNPGTWGDSVGTVATTDVGGMATKGSTKTKAGEVQALTALPPPPPSGYPGSGIKIDTTALLSDFQSRYGLNLSGVAPLLYGVGTGTQLDYLGLPLAADQTYYYARVNNGPSVSFGGISAGASTATSFTLVINMADPSVYVSAGPVTFGGSVKGLIPFKANASSYGGPSFSGNLWGKVPPIQLGSLPVSIGGDATINLDPLKTGSKVQLNGNASQFFGQSAGSKIAKEFANIGIGINGDASVGYTAGGFSVTMPVGSASVGYIPTSVQGIQMKSSAPQFVRNSLPAYVPATDELFSLYKTLSSDFYDDVTTTVYNYGLAGSTTNPLKGTPLESVFSNNYTQVSLSSSGTSLPNLAQNTKFSAKTSSGGIKLGGYTLGLNQGASLSADRNGMTVGATIGVFVGQANLSGALDLRTGGFLLTGTLDQNDFPTSQILNTTSGNLVLASNVPGYNNGLVANVNFGFNQSTSVPVLGTFGVSGNVGGSITIDTTNSNYGGSIYANGSLTAFSRSIGGGIGASLSGRTITITTPVDYFKQLKFNIA